MNHLQLIRKTGKDGDVINTLNSFLSDKDDLKVIKNKKSDTGKSSTLGCIEFTTDSGEFRKTTEAIKNHLAEEDLKFNLSIQEITIGDKSHYRISINGVGIKESLKFTKENNLSVASVKVPKDKRDSFINDVSQKFNLKKFKKYGTELYSASSNEKTAKYFLLKTIGGDIFICINTAFDTKFHTDIESFKEYASNLADEMKPVKTEQEQDEVEETNPFKQPGMDIAMFKEGARVNESKFIKEHHTTDGPGVVEIFGQKGYELMLESTQTNNRNFVLKNGFGVAYKIRVINEDKIILEEIGREPQDTINSGTEDQNVMVAAKVLPCSKVNIGILTMYYIGMASGAKMLVIPEMDYVKVFADEAYIAQEVDVCDVDSVECIKEDKQSLTDALSKKGWEKDGDFYKWTKFSTSSEQYLLGINTKEKVYNFVYDPIITDDERKVKVSKLFAYEDESDIIIPTSMDEFDHMMLVKTVPFRKGQKVMMGDKKVTIKKYDFGDYIIKKDGEEEKVSPKELKKIVEEKTLEPLLSDDVISLFNEAIASELYASHLYKHIANQLQKEGYAGAQKYFLAESGDELEHHQKLVDFMNDLNVTAKTPAIPGVSDKEIESIGDALYLAYETEKELLIKYESFYKFAHDAGDIKSATFVSEFVQIQRKSVGEFGDLIARFSKNETDIFEFDEYLEELTKQ